MSILNTLIKMKRLRDKTLIGVEPKTVCAGIDLLKEFRSRRVRPGLRKRLDAAIKELEDTLK